MGCPYRDGFGGCIIQFCKESDPRNWGANMFGSTILDLAVGLIYTFLIVSLITSAATEGVASFLSWRANTLLQGVKNLLNDSKCTGLALSLYNHGLVNPQGNGTATEESQLGVKPSYIDPKQFASALIDVAGIAAGASAADMQARINATVTDPQLNQLLNGIVARTGANLDQMRGDIAGWFDNAMDRVSGDYKRKTQLWSLGIALALAILLNVDTVKISQALWNQPMVVKSLPQLASDADPQTAITKLQNLGVPFGWDQSAVAYFLKGPNFLFAVFGWLMTAIATLFGAPFWFDTLQRFVQLRGAGGT